MTPDQQRTLRDFYEAATKRDSRALRALLSDDFRFRGPIASFDDPDDYVEHLVGFDGWVDGSRYIADGDRVAHLFVLHLNAPAETAIPMCDVFTFDGGLIKEQELFTDSRLFPAPS